MANSIDFLNRLSPAVTLSADTSLAIAHQTLAEQPNSFLVIDGADAQALVSSEQLANFPSTEGGTLADLLELLPPLVTLSATWASLSTEQIEALFQALALTEAAGILVYYGQDVLGIISPETLADFMPREVTRVSRGLAGDSSVPFRMYSCQTCGALRIPATGESTPPRCPQSSSHGLMALES